MAWAGYPERRILARRDLLKASGAAAFALALAACGGSSATSTPAATAGGAAPSGTKAAVTAPGGTTVPSSAVAATSATTTGATGASTAFNPPADLLDKAKKEGKVQLYTSLDTQIVDAIIKPFKDKFGIDVQYFRGGSTDVSTKLLAEADAGKVQADVVDTSDIGSFLAFKKRGVLATYDSPYASTIAANLRDPEKQWISCRLTTAVIEWNTSAVSAPPMHWKDLTDPKWSGKLIFSGSANGDAAPRLYVLSKTFGDDLLKGFAANKPLRVTTPQLETQSLENGERAVGFVQNDNIAQRSKLQGKPTNYLFPDDGVPVEQGAVGILKNAPHPNAAILFHDWWISTEGQTILVDGGKYSSRSDLQPPKGNPPLSALKLLLQDYADYESNRSAVLDKMTKIFGGEWGV
ncbi:MAG: extracellular solute-binding protein [Chloroflexota bacterium]|nr:extracellular solute-binding protein [Chloroflexota bacterium]